VSETIHDRFKLLEKCGTGGSGEVYIATDLRLKRRVAVKRTRRDTKGDRRDRAQRLLREAEYLCLSAHPNVVVVHDVLESEDSVTIVMEFIEGLPFSSLYARRRLEEEECLAYLRQLLGAVASVHAAGIVHRDIQPRNVLVTAGGLLKLTDFGLAAKPLDPDARAGGTIGYMAPEALRKGGRIWKGLDIYGMGMLAYQALLGAAEFQKLYRAESSVAWARWLLSRERFRPLTELGVSVSSELAAVVDRMLEKREAARYQTVAEIERDLEKLRPRAAPSPVGPSLVAGVRRLLPSILARPKDPRSE
jgi:serine/threonine-protein kinase